jgi:hypothetical protein
MEWLTGLALLPALACGVMMGGMAIGAVLGLRRRHNDTAPASTRTAPGTERQPIDVDGVNR